MATPSVLISINADAKNYLDAIDKVKKQTESLDKVVTDIGKSAAIGFGVLTVAIGGFVNEFVKADQVTQQLNTALKAVNGTVSITEGELNGLAKEIQGYSKFSDNAVKSSETFLLRLNNMTAELLPRAERAIVDLASAMGTDLQTATMQVGRALQDPINGLNALSRAGIKFTEDQQVIIKSMAESGKVAEAQAYILDKLEAKYKGAGEAAGSGTGVIEQLKNEMSSLSEAIGKELWPMLEGGITALKDFVKTLKDNETAIKLFANSLMIGAEVAGFIAAIAGTYKVISELSQGLEVAKLAIKAFGVESQIALAATGVGLALIVLPQVIKLLYDFWEAADQPVDLSDIDAVNEKLKDLIPTLEETRKQIQLMKESGQYSQGEMDPYIAREKALSDEIINIKKGFYAKKQELEDEESLRVRKSLDDDWNRLNDHLTAKKILEDEASQKKKDKEAQDRADKLAQEQKEYDEDVAILEERFNNGLITQQEFLNQRLAMEEDHAKLLKGISQRLVDEQRKIQDDKQKQEKDLAKKKVDDQKATFDTIAGMANSQNKTLAAIGKSFAIYQATMDTYKGINMALGAYPPPYSFAMAALVGAAGFANVAHIAGLTGFAQGGLVAGGVAGKDSVPSMLQRGELVAPAKNYDQVIDGEIARRKSEINGDTNNSNALSVIIQGNVIADDDSAVDRLIERINDAIEFRNMKFVGVST